MSNGFRYQTSHSLIVCDQLFFSTTQKKSHPSHTQKTISKQCFHLTREKSRCVLTFTANVIIPKCKFALKSVFIHYSWKLNRGIFTGFNGKSANVFDYCVLLFFFLCVDLFEERERSCTYYKKKMILHLILMS